MHPRLRRLDPLWRLARGPYLKLLRRMSPSGVPVTIAGTPLRLQADDPDGQSGPNVRQQVWGFFAQDDWKVTPRLTANLGLRYEFNSHMSDVNNRLSSIDYEAPGGRFVIASDENQNTSMPPISAPTKTCGLLKSTCNVCVV